MGMRWFSFYDININILWHSSITSEMVWHGAMPLAFWLRWNWLTCCCYERDWSFLVVFDWSLQAIKSNKSWLLSNCHYYIIDNSSSIDRLRVNYCRMQKGLNICDNLELKFFCLMNHNKLITMTSSTVRNLCLEPSRRINDKILFTMKLKTQKLAMPHTHLLSSIGYMEVKLWRRQ